MQLRYIPACSGPAPSVLFETFWLFFDNSEVSYSWVRNLEQIKRISSTNLQTKKNIIPVIPHFQYLTERFVYSKVKKQNLRSVEFLTLSWQYRQKPTDEVALEGVTIMKRKLYGEDHQNTDCTSISSFSHEEDYPVLFQIAINTDYRGYFSHMREGNSWNVHFRRNCNDVELNGVLEFLGKLLSLLNPNVGK
ncbi:hypothetical protein HAX54_046511 [Datura stramonium]|uniref:Uncharacterized protein n=1 Tax=Datura stramonium TaxID=4076 RepID=A0ABS8WH50_DATST|nr:hypothetical protein [Datura stramonium]